MRGIVGSRIGGIQHPFLTLTFFNSVLHLAQTSVSIVHELALRSVLISVLLLSGSRSSNH